MRWRSMRIGAGCALALAAAGVTSEALAQSSASAYTTGVRYDAMRRVVGTISPDPDGASAIKYAAVRNTYDGKGRLTKVEEGELAAWQSESILPSAWTGFTVFRSREVLYDLAWRKVRETLKSGSTTYQITQYSYDAQGRLNCTAVRMGWSSVPADVCQVNDTPTSDGVDRITKNAYDAAGQLLNVRQAVDTPLEQVYVAYTYSNNGKHLSVTDGKGNKAVYAYDGFDRLAAWRFPSKTTVGSTANCTIGTISEISGVTGPSETRTAGDDCEKYAYDRNGNPAKLMKRDGQVLRYTYDALNRVTLKDIPGSTTADVYYAYDLRGLQTKARFGSLTGVGIDNGYDGFSRLASTVNRMPSTPLTITYSYDAGGNRVGIKHPGDIDFTFEYDGLDRMTRTRDEASNELTRYSYRADGGVAALNRLSGSHTAYDYDAVGRPDVIQHDFSGTASDVVYGLGYNPANQVKQTTRTNDGYAFTGYTNLNRPYTTNGLNQYTAAGSASFCYDDNGNLTYDGTSVYKYDVENRLIEKRAAITGTTCPVGAAEYTGALQASLAWDPMGRLWQTSVGSAGITRFLYDGDALVAEYNSSGAVLRRYVHGVGPDEPLSWYEGATVSTTNWRPLYTDHLGSVVAAGTVSATVHAIRAYDEYGIPTGGDVGRFQYTGQAWLPELGMYHYKSRIYSPTLGRFLQTDPIGYEDQVNLYAYVGNDSVNGRDPTGMYECEGESDQCRVVDALSRSIDSAIKLAKAVETGSRLPRASSQEVSQLEAAAKTLGKPGDGNGVTVRFADLPDDVDGHTTLGAANPETKVIQLDFAALSALDNRGDALGALVQGASALAHEAQHIRFGPVSSIDSRMISETRAYEVTSTVRKAFGWRGMSPREIQNGAVRSCYITRLPEMCQEASRRLFPGAYK